MAKRSVRASATPPEGDDDLDVSAELHGTFLKAADVKEGPLTYQISRAERVLFEARGDEPARTKIVVTLEGEPVRKLALNKTNLEVFCGAWGKRTSGWIGKAFDAYHDPEVRDLHGKRTGGLRVRLRPARPPLTKTNDDDGGVPF